MVTLPTFRNPQEGIALAVTGRFLRAQWRLQVVTVLLQILTVLLLFWKIR